MDAVTKQLRKFKETKPKEFAEALMKMSDKEVEKILYDYDLWLRDNQLPPENPNVRYFTALAGRGLNF